MLVFQRTRGVIVRSLTLVSLLAALGGVAGCGEGDDDDVGGDAGVPEDGGGDADSGVECEVPRDCDPPEDPCLTAACTAGHCVPVPLDCDDGVDCTPDSCLEGTCINTPDGSLCTEEPLTYCHPEQGCIEPLDCENTTECPGFANYCAPE